MIRPSYTPLTTSDRIRRSCPAANIIRSISLLVSEKDLPHLKRSNTT